MICMMSKSRRAALVYGVSMFMGFVFSSGVYGQEPTQLHDFSVKSGQPLTDINYYNKGATGEFALAAGVSASAEGENATAVGFWADAEKKDSLALGARTYVTVDGGVALGTDSWATKTALDGANLYLPDEAIGTPAGLAVVDYRANAAAVSVGKSVGDKIYRQITNVAAGSDMSDAVNVAQLKAVADNIQWKVKGDKSRKPLTVKNGDVLTIKGSEYITTMSNHSGLTIGIDKHKFGEAVKETPIVGEHTAAIAELQKGFVIKVENKDHAVTLGKNSTPINLLTAGEGLRLSMDNNKLTWALDTDALADAVVKKLDKKDDSTVMVKPTLTVTDGVGGISKLVLADETESVLKFSGDDSYLAAKVENGTVTYRLNVDKLNKDQTRALQLKYKANNSRTAYTVSLERGLDFTNTDNIRAVVSEWGEVRHELKKDIKGLHSVTVSDGKNTNIMTGKSSILTNEKGDKTEITAAGLFVSDGGSQGVSVTGKGLNNGGQRLTNVADGKELTDGVTLGQLQQYVQDHALTPFAVTNNGEKVESIGKGKNINFVNSETARFDVSPSDNGVNVRVHLNDRLIAELEKTRDRVAGLQTELNGGLANSAALAGLKSIAYDATEPTQLMAAVGGYRGTQAIALGVAHYRNESMMFHAGVSLDGKHSLYNAGVTWRFGSGDKKKSVAVYRPSYATQEELAAVKAHNEELVAENKAQSHEIQMMKIQIQELMKRLGM